MAGNFIVGFAPPAAGGAGKGVTAFSSAAEHAEGSLGLFGALLGAATAEEPSAVAFASAGEAVLETVTTGLLDLALPLGVEFSLETPAEPEISGGALLADLVDALAALDQALTDDEPVSPALTEQISETLDALAGPLGIPLPADPAVDPASLLPAAVDPGATAPLPGTDELDALLALAGQVPPPRRSESTFAPAPAAGTEPAVVFTAPALPASPTEPAPIGVPAPQPEAAALPPATAQAEQPATAPVPTDPAETTSVDPASRLGQLVGKITELAPALEPQTPGLARRLDALVQKLGSGEISAPVLAELGLDDAPSLADNELDQALARLLKASSEVKGTPAPQAFAAPQLRLPEVMALPPKATTPEPAPASAPVAPEAEVEALPEPSQRLTLEPRGPEPRPATPNNFADTLKSATAKPDAPVEPAQPAVQAVATAATAVVAGAKAIHAAYQAPVQQINIPQVAFEVVRQVQAGGSRFQIRLDPPELGRIDVKLDVDQSGNVNARMTVERAETLDLMQRDQRALERALAQAGLDGSKTNLEFSLRQNPFGREDGGDGRGKGSPFGGGAGGESAGLGEDVPDQTLTLYRGSSGASGVNLFV
ncbi:MAG: flagellar hook-length control protein FliK [Devosia sp.]